jgi:hypothetical protein
MNGHPEESAKDTPAGSPFAPAELAAKIREAVEAPEARGDIRVRLDVEGGQHEERYHFHFATAGSEVEAGLRDSLRGVSVEPTRTTCAPRDLTSLLSAIDVDGLVAASRAQPRFPPDSLVGRLEVGDGESAVTVVFMADEEQARSAGYEPPAAVSRLVERIYELGATAVGSKELRP